MNYFSFLEIVLAVAYSAVYGFAFGCIYHSAELVTESIKLAFSLPFISFASAWKKIHKTIKNKQKYRAVTNKWSIRKHVFDCLFFLVFGIGYLVLQYVFQDGIFRVFMLVFVLLFFYIGQKSFGNIFSKLYSRLFSVLFKITVCVLTVLMLPFAGAVSIFRHLLLRLASPLERRVWEYETICRVKKKKKMAKSSLNRFKFT